MWLGFADKLTDLIAKEFALFLPDSLLTQSDLLLRLSCHKVLRLIVRKIRIQAVSPAHSQTVHNNENSLIKMIFFIVISARG